MRPTTPLLPFLPLTLLILPIPVPAIATAKATTEPLQYRGADISSLPLEETNGISYKDKSGTTQPLEKILASNGVNTIRQRIWVNPEDGVYGTDYNVELAKRANQAGLGVYLDLHFSRSWADPEEQTTPPTWSTTDIDTLTWQVYNYTLDISNAFAEASVPVEMISIGNEIRNGLLWPLGEMTNPSNIARILHSAAWGVKDSSLQTVPKIMIHLDNGWDWDAQKYFYDSILSEGSLELGDFDMMGVSFYPFYGPGATFEALGDSLGKLRAQYGKEVAVVETNWPVQCGNPEYEFPEDQQDIPFSADGQVEYLRRLGDAVKRAEGVGLFYWEPGWVENKALGSSCEDNLLFDPGTGEVRESISVFGEI